ncbi:MAG: hypothetical protein ACWGQW_10860 [bacterium]
MSDRKKILVLEEEKLLTASIASLLSSQSGLDVISTKKGTLAGWNNTNGAQPDVVIVEEGQLVANLSDIVKLADRHPTLRLIVFGLSDGNVQIFDKQTAQVRHISDFLSLL